MAHRKTNADPLAYQTDKSQSSDLYRQIDDASLLSALAQLLKS